MTVDSLSYSLTAPSFVGGQGTAVPTYLLHLSNDFNLPPRETIADLASPNLRLNLGNSALNEEVVKYQHRVVARLGDL
jgi:hypothetical protein